MTRIWNKYTKETANRTVFKKFDSPIGNFLNSVCETGRMQFLLNLLRFCVVCVTLVAVVFLQNWQILSSAENMNPTCNTTECQELGKLYLRNMNTKTEPCTDFYDYVCHNWPIYNPKPNELSYKYIWSIEQYLQFNVFKEMKKLLENKNPSASADLEKAKQLYKVCMDIPFLPRLNAIAVRENIKKKGDFPLLRSTNTGKPFHTSWSEIEKGYVELTGESAFFEYTTQFAPGQRIDIMTELEPVESAYGAFTRIRGWPKLNQENEYKTFLYKLIRILQADSPMPKETVDNVIEDVLDLREQLTWCIATQQVHGLTQPMTILQFQGWYSAAAMSKPNAEINWLEEIRAIYKTPNDPRSTKISEMSKLNVHTTYFSCLARLLGSKPKETIVNHIHLYFAERHLELDSQMREHLKRTAIYYGPDANGILRDDPTRWKSCVENHNVKWLLQKVYTNLFFPRTNKLKIQELFENAKKLLERQISDSTWVDKETKVNSIQKVRKIKPIIGYPDWMDINAPPVPGTERLNPLNVDAEFDNGNNRIYVSSAYLQYPMYIQNMPYVIDYGATINLFGHELHHAFDSDGIDYNSEGVKRFWSNSMKLEQANRTKCFMDQFVKHKENFLKKHNLKQQYPFVNSVDEDMADVMGLKLSYMGFQEMLKKNRGYCPVLPGFEKLGCEQLFFIAFANTFCSYLTLEHQEALLYEDSHSLPAIRVNGAVANMKEFSAAFGCKSDAPLNLHRTCDFWKQ